MTQTMPDIDDALSTPASDVQYSPSVPSMPCSTTVARGPDGHGADQMYEDGGPGS